LPVQQIIMGANAFKTLDAKSRVHAGLLPLQPFIAPSFASDCVRIAVPAAEWPPVRRP
jgi:hypothetical protein